MTAQEFPRRTLLIYMAGNWTSYAVAIHITSVKFFMVSKEDNFPSLWKKLAISLAPGIGYSIHKLKWPETGQHTVQVIQVNIWICK